MSQSAERSSNVQHLKKYQDRLKRSPEGVFQDDEGLIKYPKSIRGEVKKTVKNILADKSSLTPEETEYTALLDTIKTLRRLLEELEDPIQKEIIETQLIDEESKTEEKKKAAETAKQANREKFLAVKRVEIKTALRGVAIQEIHFRTALYEMMGNMQGETATFIFNLMVREIMGMEDVKKELMSILKDPENENIIPPTVKQKLEETKKRIIDKKVNTFAINLNISAGELDKSKKDILIEEYKKKLKEQDITDEELSENLQLDDMTSDLLPLVIELAEKTGELDFSRDMPAIMAIASEIKDGNRIEFGQDKVPSVKDYIKQLREGEEKKYPKAFQEIDENVRKNLKNFKKILEEITTPMGKLLGLVTDEIPEELAKLLYEELEKEENQSLIEEFRTKKHETNTLAKEFSDLREEEQKEKENHDATIGKLTDMISSAKTMEEWDSVIQRLTYETEKANKRFDNFQTLAESLRSKYQDLNRSARTLLSQLFNLMKFRSNTYNKILKRFAVREGKPIDTAETRFNKFTRRALHVMGLEDWDSRRTDQDRWSHKKNSDDFNQHLQSASTLTSRLEQGVDMYFSGENIENILPEDSIAYKFYKNLTETENATRTANSNPLENPGKKHLQDLQDLLRDAQKEFVKTRSTIDQKYQGAQRKAHDLEYDITNIARGYNIYHSQQKDCLSPDKKENPLYQLWGKTFRRMRKADTQNRQTLEDYFQAKKDADKKRELVEAANEKLKSISDLISETEKRIPRSRW